MAETTDRSSVSAETFTIPVGNIAKLTEKIGKLNKRADKIGVTPITYTLGTPSVEEVDGARREVLPVTIVGKAPILNGWQFIATLEHDEDGTVIRRIPTFAEDVDLSQYRNATPENCDYCGYKRRRNDTYIVAYVAEESHPGTSYVRGETMQVGSNCLKDFTGHESPQQIAKFLEQVREFIENLRGGGYSEGGFVPRFSTREYMAHVVRDACVNGWVSKKQAWEDNSVATAQSAETSMRMTPSTQPEVTHYEWADKIIAWAESLTENDLGNDYLWNLHTVLKNGSLTARQFGIAASGIQAYKRAQADSYAGEIGERVSLTFTVGHIFDNEAYKTYVMTDKLGRKLKWMTNQELEVGETYTGTFNVKAHDEHERFGKQTFVNYPRNLEKVS